MLKESFYRPTIFCRGIKKRQRLIKDHVFKLDDIKNPEEIMGLKMNAIRCANDEMRSIEFARLKLVKFEDNGNGLIVFKPYSEDNLDYGYIIK